MWSGIAGKIIRRRKCEHRLERYYVDTVEDKDTYTIRQKINRPWQRR